MHWDARLRGTGPKRRITQGEYGNPIWSRNGFELFYSSTEGGIWAVAIETRPKLKWQNPLLLFKLPGPIAWAYFPFYDPSPDGQRFVFAKRPEEKASREIRVVLNWFEELKERVPAP